MTQEEVIDFCKLRIRELVDEIRVMEKDHPWFSDMNKTLKCFEAALVSLTIAPDVYVLEKTYSTETMRARRYKVEVMDKDLESGFTLYRHPHYKVES